MNIHFTHPTANTSEVISHAKCCLRQIYKAGFQYKKAGVMLLDLIPDYLYQYDILDTLPKQDNVKLIKTLDAINKRFGNKTLYFCAEGTDNAWKMKRDKISKRYTTSWNELAIAKCK
jgi:DNA polymerase V